MYPHGEASEASLNEQIRNFEQAFNLLKENKDGILNAGEGVTALGSEEPGEPFESKF